ncbi:MAG: plasmid mobilization relaxosome protein MobC [Oscillospiraceae bacterium]|nr:plasmid mobilization relaxosome protein MobC [Oscillospiraceae bacterium]
MKVRNRKITVRLTDTEREHLQLQADLTGLKVEPFVRNLIMGSDMKARPQEEWAELIRQASGIAANVNQIAKKINSGAPVTEETLRLILDMQNQIWAKLKEF